MTPPKTIIELAKDLQKYVKERRLSFDSPDPGFILTLKEMHDLAHALLICVDALEYMDTLTLHKGEEGPADMTDNEKMYCAGFGRTVTEARIALKRIRSLGSL